MFICRAPYPTNKGGLQTHTYIKLHEHTHTLISKHQMRLKHTHGVEDTRLPEENNQQSPCKQMSQSQRERQRYVGVEKRTHDTRFSLTST